LVRIFESCCYPWLSPIAFSRVPSDRLARGFIACTCLYVISLLSSSWRFKRREVPHIRFSVRPEAFSTRRERRIRPPGLLQQFSVLPKIWHFYEPSSGWFPSVFSYWASLAVCSVITFTI
jgi:hypothetical protein